MAARTDATAAALIFAAGMGTRLKSEDAANKGLPKQYLRVDSTPILAYTLRIFQKISSVGIIYLVVNPNFKSRVDEIQDEYQITKLASIVPGGSTALGSIFNGLDRMVSDGMPGDTVVLVHDGVRPIITQDMILRNISGALENGNAITCIPAFETAALRESEGDLVSDVVDRQRAVVLQAPQTFRLEQIHGVNVQARHDGILDRYVDQAGLCNHYGVPLHLVDGIRGNIKITTTDDLGYFSYLVQSGEYERLTSERVG